MKTKHTYSRPFSFSLLFAGLIAWFCLPTVYAETVWLDELTVLNVAVNEEFRPGRRGRHPRFDIPKINQSILGNPLNINDHPYKRGIGTHAFSVFLFDLHRDAKRFTADVGIDSGIQSSIASVEFLIYADGEQRWSSGVLGAAEGPAKADVDLTDIKELALVVTDAGDGIPYDHADWADAKFSIEGKRPTALELPKQEPYILTPKPPKTPRINGAKVFGVRPGSPFLYTIAATGERPVTFSVMNLPDGLRLDPKTGRIDGKLNEKGTYRVTLTAENIQGKTKREFRIVVGDAICLTPPMGWNSWNCWAKEIDADKVKAAAAAMKESGLIDHGWTYVNIDDAWQATRSGEFNAIQGNDKFPDMKKLCDYVHDLGLKIGIYSTPWITSYAGFPGGSSDNEDGSWKPSERSRGPRGPGGPPPGGPGGPPPGGPGGPPPGGPGGPPPGGPGGPPPGGPGDMSPSDRRHGKISFAQNDAKQWAAWGFDYLKYDWRPNDVPHVKEMGDTLQECGRDIIYSLSNNASFEQAEDWARHSNAWRTTGDIMDSWSSMATIGFDQSKWADFAGPGHWNDPDMLVVGYVGWGRDMHPSNLSPDEQYTHISLWCLLASPLLIGCDLTRLDDFTLNLLTNDEVLEVNQDPLGKQAVCIDKKGTSEVWMKEMEDGSKAVGLFNRDFPFLKSRDVTVRWSDLGIEGEHRVRDLWRQKNLGAFHDSFTAEVRPHGVVLIRVFSH